MQLQQSPKLHSGGCIFFSGLELVNLQLVFYLELFFH